MTDIPPPRWRVIERGRRLEVIDTHSKGARTPAPVDRRTVLSLPKQVRFDGGAELTTHALYDDKAPRTILLDPGSAAMLKRAQIVGVIAAALFVVAVVFWPWLLVALIPLFQPKARQPIRRRVTRWLDRAESESS